VNRVGNPGYTDTKSASADYAAVLEREGRTRISRTEVSGMPGDPHRRWGSQSAKADFVVL
jgi:hypothetical protein